MTADGIDRPACERGGLRFVWDGGTILLYRPIPLPDGRTIWQLSDHALCVGEHGAGVGVDQADLERIVTRWLETGGLDRLHLRDMTAVALAAEQAPIVVTI